MSMRFIVLLISLVLLVTAIVILYTETEREPLSVGMVLCVMSGFGFRVVTEEEDI